MSLSANRREFGILSTAAAFAFGSAGVSRSALAQRSATGAKPNIVFILTVNLGYGDIGPFGGGDVRGAPTPRLDAMAREGLRLTNFNVEPECTPSRSALFTGRMPIRSGTSKVAIGGLPEGISPWEYTLAQLLSDSGYQTAMYGKWHLGDRQGRFPSDRALTNGGAFPIVATSRCATCSPAGRPTLRRCSRSMRAARLAFGQGRGLYVRVSSFHGRNNHAESGCLHQGPCG